MKRTFFSFAVGGLALSLVAGLWAQNAKSGSPASGPAKWQHLAFEHEGTSVIKDPALARQINQLGDKGWELVDVETVVDSGKTQKTIFFFKRPQ